MPKVEFSTKEVRNLLGKESTPETETKYLRERIPMLGVDVESMDDEKIVLEIFPNRPDMLSVEGFSRALSAFIGIKPGMKRYNVTENNINENNINENKTSGVELFIDPSVCNVRPYISAAVIRNVKLDEDSLKSIMDIQEKLHITHGRGRKKVAIGVHNLDAFEQPLQYKASGPNEVKFRPLNFEKEIYLDEIINLHPKGKEFSHLLKNFGKYPVITDKNGKVLSMPPIINSELTKVTEKTKNLFIEITGTDSKAVNQALNMIVTSIKDRCSGEICSVTLIDVK